MTKQEKKHRNIRVTAKKQRNKKEQNRRNTVGIQKPNIPNLEKIEIQRFFVQIFKVLTIQKTDKMSCFRNSELVFLAFCTFHSKTGNLSLVFEWLVPKRPKMCTADT